MKTYPVRALKRPAQSEPDYISLAEVGLSLFIAIGIETIVYLFWINM